MNKLIARARFPNGMVVISAEQQIDNERNAVMTIQWVPKGTVKITTTMPVDPLDAVNSLRLAMRLQLSTITNDEEIPEDIKAPEGLQKIQNAISNATNR